MKKILFVASEAVPFIKTGGLADVVGSLPKCFDKRYYDVRIMIPKYLCIKQEWRDKLTYVDHFYMDYLGESRYVGILTYVLDGITYYFIDNESYFNGPKPYGDWLYDLEKFSFFCNAALSALPGCCRSCSACCRRTGVPPQPTTTYSFCPFLRISLMVEITFCNASGVWA